ncbi:hypothetical protein SAMN06295879_1390 [Agreia bicolorata]|uniref:Gram-positive cocci surface proteins LPxTG domain-containing protein n=1 Tax=Agreia bicolorata TaxID=110935 RepID=A0A1T4XP77_9MICO|nr:DUF5979 domain-containing protein [Agreia bicolorata]SKA90921.1 hypothetical protein SAMN06295879_1390 [Agreia bicolorata]
MHFSVQKNPRTRAHKRGAAAIALSVVTALVAGGMLAGASTPAFAADGSVSGRVYRDFNSNGSFDSGNGPTTGIANDKGLAGVVATATDGHGKVWSATTQADGTYSIPVVDASGTAVRVAFTDVPDEYEPASHGADNGTSVQFVSVGDSGVDYGVNAPDDFSQGNPPIVTAIQYAGLSSSPGLSETPAIVAQPWGTSFTSNQAQGTDSYPDRVVLATVPQVGSTWGSSFQASTGSLFAAATYKRHAGLGPLGLGGIYRVTGAVEADGDLAPSGSSGVQEWLDVRSLGIDVGSVAADATPTAQGGRGLGWPSTPTIDADAFVQAGKVGIGGIAVSTDQKSLYFVNLFDKKIYQLDISDPAVQPTVKNVIDLGLGDGERPWALTVHRNQLFAGYVDSGEQLPTGSSAATLQYHVLSAPESALNADSTPAAWTSVLDGSLGYKKGDPLTGANVSADDQKALLRWNAWVDEWSGSWGSVGRSAWGSPVQAYPQPMLTDLDFDTDGYLNLSLADRTSIQGGNRNYGTDDTTYYQTVSSGDLLVAAPTATGYVLENNGTVGDRPASATAGNNEGPGGGEYYNDRQALGTGGIHHEIGLGGLATLAGVDSIVATTYDPLNDVRVTGLNWFQPSTGNVLRGYQQIADAGGGSTPGASGTFQKGGGLAVVQALAQLAPVEIGNRVWFDADQDGIQDADEPALDGVTVDLVNADGKVIGTTTTANGGEYYFSTTDPALEAEGFVPGSGSYTVRFTKPATGNAFTDDSRFGTVSWSDVRFTTPDQGDDDTVDSDAIPTPGDDSSASISIPTIGAPGENNHTFDAGLIADGTLAVVKKISEDGGVAPAGATYTVDLAATDFRGDALDVGANASIVVDPTDPVGKTVTLPVGSSATITEGADATVKSYSVSPKDAVKVTGTRTAPTIITVTNTLFADGFFEVTKSVTGAAAGSVSPQQQFTVSYTYPGLAEPKTLIVTPGGKATSDAIPYGTEVTISEAIPTGAPADVLWGTPIWTVDDGASTPGASTTLTIGDGSTIAVGLENPTTQLVNGFSVTKLVTGDAAESVPDDFAYTVNYTTPGQAAKQLTLTKADSVKTVTGLPLGTVVTLSEDAPGDAAPDVKWGTPVFSGVGVTPNLDGTASFTIGDEPVQVVLTNPTELVLGSFSITKQVTGPAADTLTPGFTFTGTYLPAGAAEPKPFSLTNGSTFTSPDLPAGTVVTLTEDAPQGGLPELSGWAKPIFLVDGQPIGTDGPVTITIGQNSTLAVTLENPTTVTPKVSIVKGDVVAGVFHNADTMIDGEFYEPGETRQISITATNTGTDRLREVVLHDDTLSGAAIQSLVWTFPGGSTATASVVDGELTARWDATFAPGTTEWMPGATITGTATLTVANSDAAAHVDRVTVDAKGSATGTPVTDHNDYNAYTAAIQVIKYDGSLADPAVKDAAGNWIVPTKPLASAAQDANDADHAVVYEAGKAKHVRWVVTNTGNTWLTEISLADATLSGPKVTNWTSDLSAFGGPSSYSFEKDGTWHGMLPPGASFFSDGTLTLGVADSHADDVTVVGTPIVPEVDENGVPTGKPQLDENDKPVLSRNPDGTPRTLTDHDPFHAVTPAAASAAALPNTGLDLGAGLRVGLLALLTAVAGLGALLLVRRRRVQE